MEGRVRRTGSVSGCALCQNATGSSGLDGSLVGTCALASKITGTASGVLGDGISNARLSAAWDGLGSGHSCESQEGQ